MDCLADDVSVIALVKSGAISEVANRAPPMITVAPAIILPTPPSVPPVATIPTTSTALRMIEPISFSAATA